jgi:hypothetical protein
MSRIVFPLDYESAAELCDKCRKNGIQGSHINFLICAVAKRLDVPIFTTDKDFSHQERIISVKLHRGQRSEDGRQWLEGLEAWVAWKLVGWNARELESRLFRLLMLFRLAPCAFHL